MQEVEGGSKRGGRGNRAGSGVGGEAGRSPEIEQRCVMVGDGELGIATRKFQTPGKQEVPRTQQEWHEPNSPSKGS